MKVEPIRHNATPEYLQKLTAILAAGGMLVGSAGCSSAVSEESSDITTTTTEELELAGEVAMVTDASESEASGVDYSVTEEELQISGDVAMFTDPTAGESYNEDLICAFAEKEIAMETYGNTESYDGLIVEVALFSEAQQLAVCYYQNASYSEPLTDQIAERDKQGKATAFERGYTDQMEISGTTCRVIFVDVTNPLTTDDLTAIPAYLEARGVL